MAALDQHIDALPCTSNSDGIDGGAVPALLHEKGAALLKILKQSPEITRPKNDAIPREKLRVEVPVIAGNHGAVPARVEIDAHLLRRRGAFGGLGEPCPPPKRDWSGLLVSGLSMSRSEAAADSGGLPPGPGATNAPSPPSRPRSSSSAIARSRSMCRCCA